MEGRIEGCETEEKEGRQENKNRLLNQSDHTKHWRQICRINSDVVKRSACCLLVCLRNVRGAILRPHHALRSRVHSLVFSSVLVSTS